MPTVAILDPNNCMLMIKGCFFVIICVSKNNVTLSESKVCGSRWNYINANAFCMLIMIILVENKNAAAYFSTCKYKWRKHFAHTTVNVNIRISLNTVLTSTKQKLQAQSWLYIIYQYMGPIIYSNPGIVSY